jgi:hypothetical protein
VLSIVISTLAFFIATILLKRWAAANDFPKGMTLNVTIFVAAIGVAYGVAWLVDQVVALGGG